MVVAGSDARSLSPEEDSDRPESNHGRCRELPRNVSRLATLLVTSWLAAGMNNENARKLTVGHLLQGVAEKTEKPSKQRYYGSYVFASNN